MASEEELTSDSLEGIEREIPDFLLKDLKSRVLHFISESKDFSAKILNTSSGQYKLIFSLGSRRHAERQMNMGTSPDTNAILVKNIPSTVDEDLLEVFFESRKKNGGGPVKSVKLFCKKQFAVVEFEEAKSVQIVMKKTPIKYGKTTLDVQPYLPLLAGDGNITSLDVNGLPKQLTEDILDMHLNSIAKQEYPTKKVFEMTGSFPSSSTALRQEQNSQKGFAFMRKNMPSFPEDDGDSSIKKSDNSVKKGTQIIHSKTMLNLLKL